MTLGDAKPTGLRSTDLSLFDENAILITRTEGERRILVYFKCIYI